MPDQDVLSALETLTRKKPAKLMAQLTAVWPQVEKALAAGHTLRVIHECLTEAGMRISYSRLTDYRSRLRRRKSVAPANGTDAKSTITQPASVAPFDPLANLRKQEQKRLNWEYPSGPPDESKLI